MEPLPQVGQLVRVVRGKEAGGYAVIVRVEEGRFVWLADGHKRRFNRCKRKNVQHVELLAAISSEVADSLLETGTVTNGKLRFAIQKYSERKENDCG